MLKRFIILLCCFSFAIPTTLYAKQKVDQDCLSSFAMLNDSSGYRTDQGEMAGYHVEFLKALDLSTELCLTINLQPYSRALRNLHKGKVDIGIIARAQATNDNFVYLTKLISAYTVVIPRQGLHADWHKDLSKIRIGRFRGVDLKDTVFKGNTESMVNLSNYGHGLRLLEKERIDAIIGNNLGLSIFKKQNILHQLDFSKPLVLGKREIWLVMSKKSYHKDKLHTLKQASKAMIQDGSLDRILDKHFGENWRAYTQ